MTEEGLEEMYERVRREELDKMYEQSARETGTFKYQFKKWWRNNKIYFGGGLFFTGVIILGVVMSFFPITFVVLWCAIPSTSYLLKIYYSRHTIRSHRAQKVYDSLTFSCVALPLIFMISQMGGVEINILERHAYSFIPHFDPGFEHGNWIVSTSIWGNAVYYLMIILFLILIFGMTVPTYRITKKFTLQIKNIARDPWD